jgi:hypothetical protein
LQALTVDGWKAYSPLLPVTVMDHCSVLFNDSTVLILGGTQNGTASPNTYFFVFGSSTTWERGPTMIATRTRHSCNLIPKEKGSQEMSIIAVGGQGLSTTEFLDDLTGNWKPGPGFSFTPSKSVLVMHPLGGVVLVGGSASSNPYNVTNKLYRLQHAGPLGVWELMIQTLTTARFYHTAFLIPAEITNCN